MNRHLPSRRRSARPSLRPAVSRVLEALENRLAFDMTYAPLATSALTQNWTETDLITTDNDWSGVPSITGFRGDNLTGGTGVDPQTILADTAAAPNSNPVGVFANQTDPNTFISGGPAEYEITNPTVALAGSGTADAPSLVFYLDTTGVSNVTVQYTLRDLDSSGDNAIQPIALQYRIGTTGDFTNVPAAFTADASAGPNVSGPDVPVNVTLDNLGGNAQVQLRVITTNAVGSDEVIGIDDINIVGSNTNSPGTLGFSPSTYAVNEGGGSVSVTVRRTGGATGAVSANYALVAGTATTPADFGGPLSGTVSFANGETTRTITIPIVQDAITEGTESFTLSLASPTGGAVLGAASATVNITDDETPGAFAFNPATLTVNENAGNATLTVTRTGGTDGAITVNYVTADGTALSPDDYTAATAGTLTFAAGQTTGTISIPLTNDAVSEGLENFTVRLTGANLGGTIGTAAVATVTINDDDSAGTLAFDPAAYSVVEDTGSAVLTVRRTGGTGGAVSVNYALVAGTASAADFAGPTSGTLTFAAGVETATITVPIVDDALTELDEAFTVTLSGATGGAVVGTDATATVTIVDDDFIIPLDLRINEIFIDPPSFNQPFQYVELKGTPGQVLNNVFLIQVEGDTATNPGQIDQRIDLSGAVIGSNGLLFVQAADGGFAPQDSATGVFTTPLLNATPPMGVTSGFELTSATFLLLFRDPTVTAAVVPARNVDLDAQNLATNDANRGLEGLAPSILFLDGIANSVGVAGDALYAPAVGPVGANANQALDAIVRFNGNTAAFNKDAFYGGLLFDNGDGSQTLTFSTVPANLTANFPEGGIVTPGAANAGGLPSDTTPPTVISATFDPRQGQQVVVTFSEDVAASLAAGDFTLTNTTTGQIVSLVLGSVSNGGTTATLTFANTGGLTANGSATSTVLTTGNYVLRVEAGQVADAAGNALAADSDRPFAFLNADFDLNGTVGFSDLVALAQNYNTTSGATFARGDTNYDGRVDFGDLVALAQRYNSSIPMNAIATRPAPQLTAKKAPRAGAADAIFATPAAPATFNTGRRIA